MFWKITRFVQLNSNEIENMAAAPIIQNCLGSSTISPAKNRGVRRQEFFEILAFSLPEYGWRMYGPDPILGL